jgi:tRNA-2-methylthio-N6-dimethylallyladenosine synthase
MSSENKIIDEKLQGQALMLEPTDSSGNKNGKKLFLESYGCQMNFSDSEIVASILIEKGFQTTENFEEADLIFLNTCAIRENAELRIRNRLNDFKRAKKKNPKLLVGILGCMAERLKSQLLDEEKLVDIVVGPDAYRDLPNLIETADDGRKAINVILSKEETYADLTPVRIGSNGVTAYISITRGCDNMCSFCVVPFTRGRERSRDPESVVNEAKDLFLKGYKEVILLGQNVDSYLWSGGGLKKETLTEEQKKNSMNFAQLLEKVALIDSQLRVRFSTSHPKDMTNEVLEMVAKHHNICNSIHLPVQSGSNRILEMMNRGYTREWYLDRMAAINRIIPDCGISTDIITGFCSETEEEHLETISLMQDVKFDFAYMFSYSERPKTLAERKYKDDVPESIKSRRLTEIVNLQRENSAIKTAQGLGKIHEVLVDGFSKKSTEMLKGRNSQNAVVVFPKGSYNIGDYVNVKATSCTTSTLIGEVV